MGLIANLALVFTDLGDFFQFCRDFFGVLPFAIKLLIYFVFGSIILFGIFKLVIKVGS